MEKLDPLDPYLQEAYENFGNAVIKVAVDDYRELKRQNADNGRVCGKYVSIK